MENDKQPKMKETLRSGSGRAVANEFMIEIVIRDEHLPVVSPDKLIRNIGSPGHAPYALLQVRPGLRPGRNLSGWNFGALDRILLQSDLLRRINDLLTIVCLLRPAEGVG